MDAIRGEYPWMCNLLYLGLYHICGCSIIGDQYILSAAHCFGNSGSPSAYKILIGNYDLSVVESSEKTMSVSNLYVHEGWNQWLILNDIAILKLSTKIDMTNLYVNTVCLPQTNPYTTDNLPGFIMGWGDLKNVTGKDMPQKLQKGTTTVQTDAYCSGRWGTTFRTGMMVCAHDRIMATCVGDSGGPLCVFDQATQSYVQVGIVSYGSSRGCLDEYYPSVFARVATYRDWISQKMLL